MGKHNKLWLSMQAVTLASVTALSACSMEGDEAEQDGKGSEGAMVQPADTAAMPSYGEGGEGGEGEGEGAEGPVDLATDDLAYLTQLGLMRGHLLVGYQLYQGGHIEHAKTHMKHPKSELYAAVVPAFEARGADGFADQLGALADAVNNEAGVEAVNDAYTQLITAITASENAVGEASATPAAKLKLAVALLQTAGEEYAIGIVDGKLENAHEYQDAYGFTQIAKTTVDGIDTSDEATTAAVEKAKALIAGLEPLWPSIVPPETLQGDSSEIYGAAARIEILALGLK